MKPLKWVPPLLAIAFSLAAYAAEDAAALVGTWVQDEMGPVTIYGRRYQFKQDGSYEFAFTSRSRGSTTRRVLSREVGTFRVEGDRLVMSPKASTPKTFGWRVEKDRYASNSQLVIELADGKLDIYYPQ